MSFANLGSSRGHLFSIAPRLSRSIVNRTASRPIPSPRPGGMVHLQNGCISLTRYPLEVISTPNDFLKAIGRSSETKLSVEKWEDFWRTSGYEMRKSGLSVRDRRYILWCMEKYRNGVPVKDFAHEPKPQKTVRGWGPSVQHGKRIRSRRLKQKK